MQQSHLTWGNHLTGLAAMFGVAPPARALDLACGTGKSARELLRHGFLVEACDNSLAMLRQASHHADLLDVRFFEADMRDLHGASTYDLINCQDDALNFLLDVDDLRLVFEQVGSHLAPNGLFIFDVNTWLTFNTWYSKTEVSASADAIFVWHGKTETPFTPGAHADADLYILHRPCGPQQTWSLSHHTQRHFAPATITTVLKQAGLQVLGAYGLTRTPPLKPATEDGHGKAIYVTRRATALPTASSDGETITLNRPGESGDSVV